MPLFTLLSSFFLPGSALLLIYRTYKSVALGGLVVSVLTTGPKVRGFDPGRGRWIFKGDKNPEHHFLRRGSKAVGRRFTACKRTLRAWIELVMFRKQNSEAISHPKSQDWIELVQSVGWSLTTSMHTAMKHPKGGPYAPQGAKGNR